MRGKKGGIPEVVVKKIKKKKKELERLVGSTFVFHIGSPRKKWLKFAFVLRGK